MTRALVIRPVIMCKAPVAGAVKTRLVPSYSELEAAGIHAAMASRVIERTLRLFPNTWIAADDVSHPFFATFPVPILPQGEGDLGARMQRLARRALDYGADAALLLGTDSPHMSEARLRAAQDALKSCDVVLGPVQDGGYDLIALRGCWAELFTDIDWGTSAVLEQTLARVSQLGLRHRCLSTGFDVDTADDVQRVMQTDRQLSLSGLKLF
ncbi:MAG: hypothetical protein COW19_00255 [Zetaproteobacteria bacterium CG12_big_fil_rev_8_21_14_0_65_55_1124]|nr:MAG: hypothetical protein AUJ58_02810 [Zetaproteobacteria bacterium CG1_02_55_237]PIS18745.1 MAG: hypothetical protein COT53_09385 [Zetaproteobacteria bacterium CG08_land_8_20_14_0_20_55_17]PIW43977.1 MAG: hypothetical protein COW19_00255 [Zetaproteobacteria bacterium CG12_big_fil_rev_8_21_14_0_65_55_1124]PIY52472.1 MAG: hypothetical protein COZ01_07700 [Zetaproteobacteria bacterium CG_4_10_14_0_8_um_filter_55_43]PIZ36751.1 MAG: hypothetical protein COY36_11370 [Zetaproteobacteria bacterium 